MKKSPFIKIVSTVLFGVLFVSGCSSGKNQEASAPASAPGGAATDSSASPTTASAGCPELKTSSGGYVYTEADAVALFGGKWENKGFSDDSPICSYPLWGEKLGQMINLQAVIPASYNAMQKIRKGEITNSLEAQFKDVPSLGEEAFFTWYGEFESPATLLNVKQGSKIIAVGCIRNCTEDQYVSIAKTVVSRW